MKTKKAPTFRPAAASDLEILVFDSRAAEKAMKRLLGDESLGRVWLVEEADMHISAAHRGRGVGKRVLACVHEFCAAQGIRALRLEVEHENIQAQSLYRKAGFKEHSRHLMTKWLDDSR
ncbi:MAG: N-acetyltransferase [Bacteroidota bacterium]